MAKLPRVRWYRDRLAISQEELARLAGVSRVTVTRIESGEDTFPSTARKIAQALSVTPAALMDDGEAKDQDPKRAA